MTALDLSPLIPLLWMQGILPLAVFAKEPLSVTFTGITNDATDLSVDILRNVTLPFLKNFGVDGCALTIKKRGAAPLGGGLVELTCPIVRQLVPINVTDMGLVKRVRGVVFCTRISPTIITRVSVRTIRCVVSTDDCCVVSVQHHAIPSIMFGIVSNITDIESNFTDIMSIITGCR